MKKTLLKKMGAEFIGTFALVFAGCGAIVSEYTSSGSVTHTGISATFGLVVMIMIYATGHISGAHFNPAVTVSFAVSRRFPWTQVLPYVCAQVFAALLAALTLRYLFGNLAHLGATTTALSFGKAFLIEAILSGILMFVIMAVATDARAAGLMAGVAIGGTVACAALFGGPMTGASMNPARSLGPALVSGHLDQIGLYVSAPLVGAIIGGVIYTLIRCESDPQTEDAKGCC